ncbi:MAG: excinuclease ABC subunit UvrC [Clostridia bacterium]|nr:excinuclease ABC subunit UvrC [Clostridia bacterium]
MINQTVKTKLALLPDSPGCYLMKHQGQIIYVGKAVNLKNRVRSYFHTREHTPKVAAMVAQVDDFDILLCNTNLEALALECNLIKLHKPHYNILLKDDKHYPYVRIDKNEPFPRVTIARRMQKDGAQYFGPNIGAAAVRDALEVLRKAFPLRTCDKKLPLARPIRPCVNHEIGRCLAPCAGKCTQEEYRQVIDGVISFLNGNVKDITEKLQREMKEASAAWNFELAAQKRDALKDIEGMLERQRAIQTNDAQQDVLALAQDGLDAMAQVLIIRNGRIIGGESFALPGEGNEPPETVLTEFALRYYADRQPPREILAPRMEDAETMQQLLREKRGSAVNVVIPQRGEKRALVLMAERNAADALEKRNARQQVHEERTVGACRELAQVIGMAGFPHRIEGFDISNTQGVLSVASMVVFIDGEPAHREYRHYRIKTVEGPNDFASMNEVLSRRFARTQREEEGERWVMPDLILVDGGPQQLRFAQEAMRQYNIQVPMFGLAERLEEIWLPGREESILLDRRSPALHLIQAIRDEAHRFAITYHRSLRGKAQTHSSLEDIPGIGPGRRRALLQYFGSIKRMKEADVDTLLRVSGMTRPAAQAVYDALHPRIQEEGPQL